MSKPTAVDPLTTNSQSHQPLPTSEMTADNGSRVDLPVIDIENVVAGSEKPQVEKKVLSAAEEDAAGKVYPPTKEVIPVMVAIFMALLLISLVRP
jgi:hypothetical protein